MDARCAGVWVHHRRVEVWRGAAGGEWEARGGGSSRHSRGSSPTPHQKSLSVKPRGSESTVWKLKRIKGIAGGVALGKVTTAHPLSCHSGLSPGAAILVVV